MSVLVTYGSKRGGTADIASHVADVLRQSGFTVELKRADEAIDVDSYDAVIVGGALYAMRWHRHARRFVIKNAARLRSKEVWFFSSGPLDDSANKSEELPPTPQVRSLMELAGANGHTTFGGRLSADAKGFIAHAMARTLAGDWRDPGRIGAWAREVGHRLQAAAVRGAARPPRPAPPADPHRIALMVLCFISGIAALAGGAALLGRTDGALLKMPLSVLERTPFDDFFVPGLLLFLVIGVGNTAAAIAHLRRNDLAPLASVVSGAAMLVWIITQMIMLRSFELVQAITLAFAVAIVWESVRQTAKVFPRPELPHGPAKPTH